MITNEEAINQLVDAKDGYKEYLTDEVLELAIAALKAEPCDRLKLDGMLEDAYEHGYQQARHDYESEPCEDCVSRDAAIKAAMQDVSDKRTHDFNAGATRAANRIKRLPPVTPITPKQRTGKWIYDYTSADGHKVYHCSECGCFLKLKHSEPLSSFKWCSLCGAKMEGAKNESDQCR